MKICSRLRGFCIQNTFAAHTISAAGITLMIASIWVAIQFQPQIQAWVAQSELLHGVAFITLLVADILLTSALVCLGFSDCSQEKGKAYKSYHGGRNRVFPESWTGALGKNPRHM